MKKISYKSILSLLLIIAGALMASFSVAVFVVFLPFLVLGAFTLGKKLQKFREYIKEIGDNTFITVSTIDEIMLSH